MNYVRLVRGRGDINIYNVLFNISKPISIALIYNIVSLRDNHRLKSLCSQCPYGTTTGWKAYRTLRHYGTGGEYWEHRPYGLCHRLKSLCSWRDAAERYSSRNPDEDVKTNDFTFNNTPQKP